MQLMTAQYSPAQTDPIGTPTKTPHQQTSKLKGRNERSKDHSPNPSSSWYSHYQYQKRSRPWSLESSSKFEPLLN
jgi:hypothetical protein